MLRKTRLSETSLIVTWLGDGCGKIKTAARGVRKGRTPQFSGVDLFAEADIIFIPAKRGDLHTLKESRLLDSHASAYQTYLGLLTCSYFAELCEWVVEPSSTHPEFYMLLHGALCYLEQNPPTLRIIHHFENRLCELLDVEIAPQRQQTAIYQLANQYGHAPSSRKRLIEMLNKP